METRQILSTITDKLKLGVDDHLAANVLPLT